MSGLDPACAELSSYEEAIAFLYQRINYEKTGHAPYSSDHYRLDRMRALLKHLGDPQLAYRVVHIAGTKGKGSTATLISNLIQASGFRVGLMTSPHLLRLEERMRVDGNPCSAGELVALAEKTRVAADRVANEGGGRATFFELTTAMGFLHFAERKVGFGVVEVGLGGRLDSTNVCSPTATVITSIGLDHQAQLGDTITQIAGEKAGIIKPGIPIICSARHPDAQTVAKRRAGELGSPLRLIERDFDCTWLPVFSQEQHQSSEVSDSLREKSPKASNVRHQEGPCTQLAVARTRFIPRYAPSLIGESDWNLSLLGSHQADNLAAALATMDVLMDLGFDLSLDKARDAILSTTIPGRLEIVGHSPVRIVDTAHNPDSITATLNALDAHFPNHSRTIVFASSKDKDTEAMLRILLPRCRRLLATQYGNNPRGLPLTELSQLIEKVEAGYRSGAVDHPQGLGVANSTQNPLGRNGLATWDIISDPQRAFHMALEELHENEILCCTGSFFLAAELLTNIRGLHSTNPTSR